MLPFPASKLAVGKLQPGTKAQLTLHNLVPVHLTYSVLAQGSAAFRQL